MEYRGWKIEKVGRSWMVTDPNGNTWEGGCTKKEAKRFIDCENVMDSITLG